MFEIGILETISFLLLSSVKILLTPIGMVAAGYSFWTTIIITSTGGALGAIVFFYMGRVIFTAVKSKKKKKAFTRKNRFIVKLKHRFGLVGIASTMGFISVPLSAILVAKYFAKNKLAVPVLVLVALAWSFVMTSISFLVYSGFTQ